MAGYKPLYIKKMETGLVQSRQQFILPDDAYPTLRNAILWREQIRRKQGFSNIQSGFPDSSRLGRSPTTTSFGRALVAPGPTTINLITRLSLEATAQITPGNISPITITYTGGLGTQTMTDTTGTGTMVVSPAGNITAASINYVTGIVTISFTNSDTGTISLVINYYPGLPVMGLRRKEQTSSAYDITIAFDTTYAYTYNGTTNLWYEWLPGTTWTGNNYQFFWSTNYWVSSANFKIMWVMNNKDPIRFTDGTTQWFNFTPELDGAGTLLLNALAMLPFRGRLLAFNTTEGAATPGVVYPARVRWSAIGTPFTQDYGTVITSGINANAWRDDIIGQGGFIDLPTGEDITAVGFVRDNLVIYCERSTWQLRYTGRNIAPFQYERVNSELGAESLFSAVQFDTSLLGIGTEGIVECDSYKAERIDVKIPDLVYQFSQTMASENLARVHGIRDFVSKMAYWTYVDQSNINGTFPNKRLAYNYENYTRSTECLLTPSFCLTGSASVQNK